MRSLKRLFLGAAGIGLGLLAGCTVDGGYYDEGGPPPPADVDVGVGLGYYDGPYGWGGPYYRHRRWDHDWDHGRREFHHDDVRRNWGHPEPRGGGGFRGGGGGGGGHGEDHFRGGEGRSGGGGGGGARGEHH